MNKKSNIVILVSLVLGQCIYSQNEYKVVNLYKNEIAFNVPIKWKVKENAMLFADYEIKYDVSVTDIKNNSIITLYVYKALYGPQMQITDSIVNTRKDGMLSNSFRKVLIEDSGVKTISGLQVGYLKYTFRVKKKSARAYGITLFFCDKENTYYKVEILDRNAPADKFRKIAEQIFVSLAIK